MQQMKWNVLHVLNVKKGLGSVIYLIWFDVKIRTNNEYQSDPLMRYTTTMSNDCQYTTNENGNSSVCHHHTHVKIRVMTIVAANNDI